MVFAGDQIDPDFYTKGVQCRSRTASCRGHRCRVRAAAGAAFAFGSWQSGHPVLRDFVDPLAGVLRQVRVYAFLGTRPENAASPRPTGITRRVA